MKVVVNQMIVALVIMIVILLDLEREIRKDKIRRILRRKSPLLKNNIIIKRDSIIV